MDDRATDRGFAPWSDRSRRVGGGSPWMPILWQPIAEIPWTFSDSGLESAGHLPLRQAQKLNKVPKIKALAAFDRNADKQMNGSPAGPRSRVGPGVEGWHSN